ncbi:DUF58 domain-containing protein [Armatimonas rosea]|uniref:Uncharacterized protein (DUF58 family) n=1 Tax=Armatimonas rosea TaxID=685828 RepID=A0A7W9W864_ARMRO|nr:DUF58 domain-containing protein [Armatimonas rosea]MBB6051302.1 uncharacterized protein (DUF58 family) [Armatimonas rosea]
MTLREIMVGYPASKDINQHPYYQGKAGQWVWRFYHFRFTRTGRWFLGLSAVVFFTIALFWNLDTQTVPLTLYVVGLWLVSSVAFLPLRAHAQLRHAERITAGETLRAEVTIQNRGRLPIPDLLVQGWGLPLVVDAQPEEGISVGYLRSGESVQVELPLHCWGRGAFVLGGCRLLTDFPFGLLQAYRIVQQPTRLIVHPAFRPLSRFNLPSGRRFQPGGIAMASQVGDSFEYLGNREWRDGDSPRDIDWRATARLAGAANSPLVVREWREEYFLRVGVVLDTHVPAEPARSARLFLREMQERLPGQPSRAGRQAALERAVSLCAAVSDALARQEYIVDLFAAGPNVYHLMAGRSLAYREQILDILACVEGSPEEPLSQIAPRLTLELDRLTTVICIVLDWDEARRSFVETLRQSGVGVKVLWVSETEEAQETEGDMQVLPPSAFASGGVDIL